MPEIPQRPAPLVYRIVLPADEYIEPVGYFGPLVREFSGEKNFGLAEFILHENILPAQETQMFF